MFKKQKKYTDQEFLSGLQRTGVEYERWVKLLFRQYGSLVYQGIRQFNVSEEVAKDAYADAVIAASRQIQEGKFKRESSLKTYLHRIFSNLCIKQFHKARRNPEWIREIPHLTDTAKNRLEELITLERIDQLYSWLEQLGPTCKEILILREFHQLSVEEIAKKIGYQNGQSVSSKRFHCLKKLKQLAKASSGISP